MEDNNINYTKSHFFLKEITMLHSNGLIDSFGIIDLVEFLEKSQKVKILDDEITKEKFGSINKMVDVVYKKKYLDK